MRNAIFGVALAAITGATLVMPLIASAGGGGFDQFGYNRTARIFNGPASGWCLARNSPADCLGAYSNDHLTMKWNAEWDRGNAEAWSNPPYRAWEDNEWNGNVPGGTGVMEHFKAVWVGDCGADFAPLPDGGYCIWGQFEALFDHYNAGSDLGWLARANPAGYGAAR